MKKIILLTLFVFSFILFFKTPSLAAYDCSITKHDDLNTDSTKIDFVITSPEISTGNIYNLVVKEPGRNEFMIVNDGSDSRFPRAKFQPKSNEQVFDINVNNFNGFNIKQDGFNFKEGTYSFNLIDDGKNNISQNYLCKTFTLDVPRASNNASEKCEINLTPANNIVPDTKITMTVKFKDDNFKGGPKQAHTVQVYTPNGNLIRDWGTPTFCDLSNSCTAFTTSELEAGVDITKNNNKTEFQGYPVGRGYKVTIENGCSWNFDVDTKASGGGSVSKACSYCPIDTYKGLSDPNNKNSTPICKNANNESVNPLSCPLTGKEPNCSPLYGCTAGFSYTAPDTTRQLPLCPNGHLNANGVCESIPSGLGVDLPTDVGGLINKLLAIFLGIVGGIAILIIIIAGYRLMMSQGNPEKIQTARETLTAALVGFLFVIFSIVILQVIGYNILGIPGFGN